LKYETIWLSKLVPRCSFLFTEFALRLSSSAHTGLRCRLSWRWWYLKIQEVSQIVLVKIKFSTWTNTWHMYMDGDMISHWCLNFRVSLTENVIARNFGFFLAEKAIAHNVWFHQYLSAGRLKVEVMLLVADQVVMVANWLRTSKLCLIIPGNALIAENTSHVFPLRQFLAFLLVDQLLLLVLLLLSFSFHLNFYLHLLVLQFLLEAGILLPLLNWNLSFLISFSFSPLPLL